MRCYSQSFDPVVLSLASLSLSESWPNHTEQTLARAGALINYQKMPGWYNKWCLRLLPDMSLSRQDAFLRNGPGHFAGDLLLAEDHSAQLKRKSLGQQHPADVWTEFYPTL